MGRPGPLLGAVGRESEEGAHEQADQDGLGGLRYRRLECLQRSVGAGVLIGERQGEDEERRDDAVVVAGLDVEQIAHPLGHPPVTQDRRHRREVDRHDDASDHQQHRPRRAGQQPQPENQGGRDTQRQRYEQDPQRGLGFAAEQAAAHVGGIDEKQYRQDEFGDVFAVRLSTGDATRPLPDRLRPPSRWQEALGTREAPLRRDSGEEGVPARRQRCSRT